MSSFELHFVQAEKNLMIADDAKSSLPKVRDGVGLDKVSGSAGDGERCFPVPSESMSQRNQKYSSWTRIRRRENT